MSLPVFTLAMFLASAPVDPGTVAPAAPASAAVPVSPGDQPPAQSGEAIVSADKDAAEEERKQSARGEDIVVQARRGPPPGDPLVGLNTVTFEATQAVDRAIVRPVALTYQKILPDPIRSGIRNLINNLREPVVFINFLLQLKPGKAAETVGRFALNSTVGAAGLFDIAKRRPFNLPRRPNGLANTFGFYGVKQGPFLFLPLIGPTTLRDFIGDTLDRLVLPVGVGRPFNRPAVSLSIAVASSLDQRAEFDEVLQEIHGGSADPYTATREDYLRSRQIAIDRLRGKYKEGDENAPPLVCWQQRYC